MVGVSPPTAERNGVKLLIYRSAGKPFSESTGPERLQCTSDALDVEYHDAGSRVRVQSARDLTGRRKIARGTSGLYPDSGRLRAG